MSGPAPNPFASNTELLEGEAKENYLEGLGIKPKKKPNEEGDYEGSSRYNDAGSRTRLSGGATVAPSNLRRSIPVLRTLSGKAKPR